MYIYPCSPLDYFSNASNTGSSSGRRFSSHYGVAAAGHSSLGSITSGGGGGIRYERIPLSNNVYQKFFEKCSLKTKFYELVLILV